MRSRPALLVSLVADPDLEVEWAVDLARGIASVAGAGRRAPVVGGDLSSAPPGVVVVSVTALGDLRGRAPVLRSGPGSATSWRSADRWGSPAVALPSSAARAGDPTGDVGGDGDGTASDALGDRALAVRALMRHHRAPVAPWGAGPVAAEAGAHALIDVSDGLVTDLGRVAAASGVSVDLDGSVLRDRYAAGPSPSRSGPRRRCTRCSPGARSTRSWATFADEASLPEGTSRGGCRPGRGAGAPRASGHRGRRVPDARGWDHFAR